MKKAQRRAPKGGYSFAEKEAYRRHVWAVLRAACPVPVPVAHALLMPSLEGAEIDVALAHGFREENIHIVDRNPAIVATLKRRYPLVNTYGVEVERACERIARDGRTVHAANFDLTSCVGYRLWSTMTDVSSSGVLHSRAAWSVTLLRGRETCKLDYLARLFDDIAKERLMQRFFGWPDSRSRWDSRTLLEIFRARLVGSVRLVPSDLIRIGFGAALAPSPGAPYTVARLGVYRSQTQTMLWSIFRPGRFKKRQMIKDSLLADGAAVAALVFKMAADYLDDEGVQVWQDI